jgi:hypothetical protein
MGKTSRFAASLMLIVLILAGLGLGSLTLLSCWAGTNLDEELARIQDRGESLDMADLVASPLPDTQNGALFYKKAEGVLKDHEEVYLPPLYEMRSNLTQASPAAVKKVEEWLEKNRECMALKTYPWISCSPGCRQHRLETSSAHQYKRKCPTLIGWDISCHKRLERLCRPFTKGMSEDAAR